MSTFCDRCEFIKLNQSFSRAGSKNSKLQKTLSLSQIGLNQAHRNDSIQIWKLFYGFEQETQADTEKNMSFTGNQDGIIEKSFLRSPPDYSISYDPSKEDSKNHILRQQLIYTENHKQKEGIHKSNGNKSTKQNLPKAKSTPKGQKQLKNHLKDSNFKIQQQGHLKKMNQEIAKRLQKSRYCSRELSNSAFSKLYKRPCVQTYGYGNTSKESAISRNLLKTHNIVPHTLQNKPSTYQTYSNAIKHAKRTKLSDQNKQQRIRRQFIKWFDDLKVQDAQLELNRINKLKRAKSLENLRRKENIQFNMQSQDPINLQKQKKKSLKELLNSNEPVFVYKYQQKDGTTRLAKDRHGISCYVDSSFSDNEKALLNFMKSENQIYPQQVKPEDMNLDQIRRENYHKSIEENLPGHYMVPCVVTLYDKTKYQFKRKKVD